MLDVDPSADHALMVCAKIGLHAGREFNNREIKKLCEQLQVVVLLSKAYCPRENGKSESKVSPAWRLEEKIGVRYSTCVTALDVFLGETIARRSSWVTFRGNG